MVCGGHLSETHQRELLYFARIVEEGRGRAIDDLPSVSRNPEAELIVHVVDEQVLAIKTFLGKNSNRHQTAGSLGNQISTVIRIVGVNEAGSLVDNFGHYQKNLLIIGVVAVFVNHFGDESLGRQTILIEKNNKFTLGMSLGPRNRLVQGSPNPVVIRVFDQDKVEFLRERP